MSLHHMQFPGTLSLQPETLISVLKDLFASAHRHGFRRLVVVNGHGGNRAALQSATISVMSERADLLIKVVHWFDDPAVLKVVIDRFGARENHASAIETSCMLAISPDRVQMEAAKWSPSVPGVLTMGTYQWRKFYPYGSVGVDTALATAEAGEAILAVAAEQLCSHLREWEMS
jgi:creatinine amidohydrolase